MSYSGTVKNGSLELDRPIDLAPGTRVEVEVKPAGKPAKGSAKAPPSDCRTPFGRGSRGDSCRRSGMPQG